MGSFGCVGFDWPLLSCGGGDDSSPDVIEGVFGYGLGVVVSASVELFESVDERLLSVGS